MSSSDTSFGQAIRFAKGEKVEMTLLLPESWQPSVPVQLDGLRDVAVVLRFAENGWPQLEQFRRELADYRRQAELGRSLPDRPTADYEFNDADSRVTWLEQPEWLGRFRDKTRSRKSVISFEDFDEDGFPSQVSVTRFKQGQAVFRLRRRAPRVYEATIS
jgi:hypothetical protein